MRKLFATDLGIWPDLRDLAAISDAMVRSETVRAKIANDLLLYDQIIIPTGNLQILPVLRLVLGENVFDEVIKEKVVVFARYDAWLGYEGNGSGLMLFTAHHPPDQRDSVLDLGLAYHTPLDQTIEVALRDTMPRSDQERRKQLTELLLGNVIEIPLRKIGEKLRDETYQDILKCPYLHGFFAVRNAGRSMNSLLGIPTNQIRILCPHSPDPLQSVPEINAVLKIAFENLLLGMATYVEASDIASDAATLSVLRAKGQHLGLAKCDLEAFARIRKLKVFRVSATHLPLVG